MTTHRNNSFVSEVVCQSLTSYTSVHQSSYIVKTYFEAPFAKM